VSSEREKKLSEESHDEKSDAKGKASFRIEEDWFSFVAGLILAFLVLFGLIKNIPW
jgi:hypothetical protein